ncbi:MAG: chemotaxis protein CheW [Clostridiales bacterium]|nr:chemotaxis protein CheW [Clostridiales bacterium]
METNIVNESRQYIVVTLGNEQFGIDIQYVDNIVRMQKITRVPKAQNYFKGVINIRGEIIPVMSLRLKFDLEDDQITNASRILILKIEPQAAVGIIVDEVREVVTIDSESVDKIANASSDEKAAYLSGVGKNGENLISLLNLQAVIIEKEAEVK